MGTARWFLMLGALLAALGVASGAFGAHALKSLLTPERLAVYQTAVQYHFYHAFGLLIVGLLLLKWPEAGGLRVAGWLLLAGLLLFSGSLYLLTLTGQRWLGAVTPLGGTAFIAAWLVVAWSVWIRS